MVLARAVIPARDRGIYSPTAGAPPKRPALARCFGSSVSRGYSPPDDARTMFISMIDHGADMSQAYRAVLQGNRVDWIDPPPAVDGPVLVEVTILHPEAEENRRARRLLSVQALQELAKAGGITSIGNPAAWEREIRRDRPLPGREG